MEEKQAVELFLQTRSEDSFCALFESIYARVRRYFLLRGLESSTAEELAQNVLFIVYQRSGDLRDKSLFNGWLFKVAKNELLRHWRKERVRSELAQFEPLNDLLAEQLSTGPEASCGSEFEEWMTYLEPSERELVILRFVEELSYEELAEAIEIPIGTVKWRLFNAKKKLSSIISRSWPDNPLKRIN